MCIDQYIYIYIYIHIYLTWTQKGNQISNKAGNECQNSPFLFLDILFNFKPLKTKLHILRKTNELVSEFDEAENQITYIAKFELGHVAL